MRIIKRAFALLITPVRSISTLVSAPFKYTALFLIRVYQKTISPDHGVFKGFLRNFGFCKYEPTCSEYTYRAIVKYGVVRGILKGAWRILRCNPWSHGGADEP
ncbi:TPA: membrane protein insertion efficiency factor YidD [Candidatus Peregrinibacteria bacterium]|nr:membrane protein insertion efficiency factor YidD [Candidatus Peregrinibacteria bacterium]